MWTTLFYSLQTMVSSPPLMIGEYNYFESVDEWSTYLSRTLRIWLRRQSGKYWPSVCYTLESNSTRRKWFFDHLDGVVVGAPTTLFYHETSRRLFCGCDSGLLHVTYLLFLAFLQSVSTSIFLGIQCGGRLQQDHVTMHVLGTSESYSCVVLLLAQRSLTQCLSREEAPLVLDESGRWQPSAHTWCL